MQLYCVCLLLYIYHQRELFFKACLELEGFDILNWVPMRGRGWWGADFIDLIIWLISKQSLVTDYPTLLMLLLLLLLLSVISWQTMKINWM